MNDEEEFDNTNQPKVFVNRQLALSRATLVLQQNGIRIAQANILRMLTERSTSDPNRLRFFPAVLVNEYGKPILKIVYFDPDMADFDQNVIRAAQRWSEEHRYIGNNTICLRPEDILMPTEWEKGEA